MVDENIALVIRRAGPSVAVATFVHAATGKKAKRPKSASVYDTANQCAVEWDRELCAFLLSFDDSYTITLPGCVVSLGATKIIAIGVEGRGIHKTFL